jgi:hypothetical protein
MLAVNFIVHTPEEACQVVTLLTTGTASLADTCPSKVLEYPRHTARPRKLAAKVRHFCLGRAAMRCYFLRGAVSQQGMVLRVTTYQAY